MGLPAFVLVKTLAPGYFAREDTRTPVAIAVVCLAVNIALSLALIGPLGHVGIALASTLSSWLNAGLLAFVLARRGHLRGDARLYRRAPRVAASAVAMASRRVARRAARLEPWFAGGEATRAAALALVVGLGLALFALAARLSGAVGGGDFKGLLARNR